MGGKSSKETPKEATKAEPKTTKFTTVKQRPTGHTRQPPDQRADSRSRSRHDDEKSWQHTATQSTSELYSRQSIRQYSVKSVRSTDDLTASKEEFKVTTLKPTKIVFVVAAIDFGTTYSGYAYSLVNDQAKILANLWNDAKVKTPTVVLMDPKQQFHSFGREARQKYAELMEDGKTHKDWYFFERFKMTLFTRTLPLNREMEIEDVLGKKMKAIDIFSASIRYMREHLLNVLNDQDRKLQDFEIGKETQIRWVLTVPAIWDDVSKKFMRDAAECAGIPSDMLYLALEPEAASLFCQKDTEVPTGHRYMVVDLGGGTADITCHEVNADGTLKELHPPTGGDFGGTSVDNEFIQLLIKVFGADIFKTFKTDFTEKYWELMEGFEIKKRNFDGLRGVNLQFPLKVREIYEKDVGETVEQSIQQSNLAGKLEFKADKVYISRETMEAIFNGTVSKIIETIQTLLGSVDGIDSIILVGGFSESPYLQREMRKNFDNIIILPKEPSSAVLKGAVMYGHNPRAISSRQSRYTYGIARMEKFVEGKHPSEKKVVLGKFTFCDDIFCKHIEIGTEVNVDAQDSAKEIKYYPPSGDIRQAVLEVYKSPNKNPKFITDPDCELVGLIHIDIDPRGDVWSQLLVKLIFGGTELHVQVRDVKNKHIMKATFDFHG